MYEVTMTIQRRTFRPAVFHRTDFDGIAFPAGAPSSEAVAAVSVWVMEPTYKNVSGSLASRLYLLFTMADDRHGQPVRWLYQMTPCGLREAFGGIINDRDVSFVWSGFENYGASRGEDDRPIHLAAGTHPEDAGKTSRRKKPRSAKIG